MKGFIVRVVLAVTRWRLVRWIFTRTRIGRRVSLRFVAGESLADAIQVAVSANDAGMPVSLNLLGENVGDEESARSSFDSYVEAIAQIREHGVEGNISVKLTQLGLGFDDELCEELLGDLARRASAAETTLTIDMEESSLTDATLDIYERAQAGTRKPRRSPPGVPEAHSAGSSPHSAARWACSTVQRGL